MANVKINTLNSIGKIKPMHCINGGPLKSLLPSGMDNREDFKKIKFPYIRNHDVSYCSNFGGEHIVDISAIFPNFDKDPYDENSYDFTLTDDYLARIREVGSDIFYRLGQKIEHWPRKYGSNPPKDFKKWAVICEHIIKHYNEGWNSGFYWDIKYWEIWNEPDNQPACWAGTMEQFYKLYEVAATHLKRCFPSIKIGGPAFAEWSVDNGTVAKFIEHMSTYNVPIDFLSWHTYSRVIEDFIRREKTVRKALEDFGYKNAESILNEWNYLVNWEEGRAESKEKIKGMEGAAFICALMSVMQNTTLNMFMYYYIQPGIWNGVFDFYTQKKFKSYYSFLLFSKMYALGTQIEAKSDDEDIYVIAASNGEKTSAMFSYYTFSNVAEDKTVTVDFADEIKECNLYLLDDENDLKLIKEVKGTFEIRLKPNSVLLLENK